MDKHKRIPAVRNTTILVFLILLLAACAGTPEPTPPPPTTLAPTVTLRPTQTTSVPTAPATVAATATAAGSPLDVAPTASPTTPPASRASSVMTESSWPHFLRELDFGIAAGNSYGPRALAVHPRLGRLYVRTHTRISPAMGLVTMLDLVSGEVLAVVETGPDDYSEGSLAVDPARDRVYAVNPGDNSASILDAGTLDLVATLDGVDQLALDAENGRVYVAGLSSLRALDADGYETLAETPLYPAYGFVALAVEPAAGHVYLVTQEADGYRLTRYDAESLQTQTWAPLLGRPDSLLPDPNRDRVYLTLNDGQQSLLWTLGGDGHRLEQRVLGEWTQHNRLALDPAGDRLFLSREVYQDNGVTVLDLAGGQEMADIPLEQSPNALAWDAGSGRLLVSHTYADRIGVVDAADGNVVDVYPTALDLVDLAVDPERGHLLVTDSAARLRVLDSDTDAELTTLPGEGHISVDGAHGRLYIGGEGADRVRIFDAAALEQIGEIGTRAKPVADAHSGGLYLVQAGVHIASLETMTITHAVSDTLPQSHGYSPNPAAVDAVVDPSSGRLFAIINNGVPGSNNGNYLYVYEPLTYQKTLTDTERSPIYVDVDPATGNAYVSRIHMSGRSTSLLAHGREYTARLDAVFGALRVDSDLGRIYLTTDGSDQGHLLILDATNLDVLGSVPIPDAFTLRALDPQRHLLYLATEGGRVQVWSAAGGELPAPVEPVTAELPADQIQRLWLAPGDRPIFSGSLYQSADEGTAWRYLGAGLPARGLGKLVVSPDFDRDQTLFALPSATDEGLGIWKSTDAGQSWRMANAGLSDLAVYDLAISPGFAQDQTLFATARKQGLFRSTDAGRSWTRLTERYYPPADYREPPGVLRLSPTYEQDQTLFIAHNGLRRSTDGGETWTRVSTRNPESLALSPAFAQDGTLFGWFGDGGLLRSTDGGETWQPASTGLALTSYGSGRVLVAPDFVTSRTIYFVWQPGLSEAPAQFYRSSDDGETWQRLAGDPPRGATPVELSARGDAFVALDGAGRLARWPVAELNWQPAALPPISQIAVDQLLLSPGFPQYQTLVAVSKGAGILRSTDAGLTWTDTGFPLRLISGLPADPVFAGPLVPFVGTPLGLYRFDGKVWISVGGGLPQGVAISSPDIGEDARSLRVFISDEIEGAATRIFLSVDKGQTWSQPLPDLPYPVLPEDVLFSPAFATDRTAFIAVSWRRPQRSLGGDWQPFGPPGEWTLSALEISPAFDQDGLLLMRLQDNGLWRSTDRGDTWRQVSAPWGISALHGVTPSAGYRPSVVTFSPSYAQDGVILARADNSLYRSTDAAATWTGVLDLPLGPSQAAFSPAYAQDGTIYLLQGSTLYQSTNRGSSWQTSGSAPWGSQDEVHLQLSPTFATDRTLLAWMLDGRVFFSSDGGSSWRDASDGLWGVRIRQVVFSPDYAADGLLYLVPHEGGIYKRVGAGPWVPVTENAPPAVQPTPVPPATTTPAPPPCATEPERFVAVWQQFSSHLGCPLGAAEQLFLAEQPFEQGVMIWDSSTSQIHALFSSGMWQTFDDTWAEGQLESDPALVPPAGRVQPKRGFGKVWREQLGGPQSAMGWALEDERPVDGWHQQFERSRLIWTDAVLEGSGRSGTAYLLFDDGTWQAISTPAP